MRLDGEHHYLSGRKQALMDVTFGAKTLDQLRFEFDNCNCGDSYDNGYNSVLAEEERRCQTTSQ